jgi:hypothetical protein
MQPGFLGVDIKPWPRVDIACDLARTLPLPDDSVIEIHSHDVFEHLPSTLDIAGRSRSGASSSLDGLNFSIGHRSDTHWFGHGAPPNIRAPIVHHLCKLLDGWTI